MSIRLSAIDYWDRNFLLSGHIGLHAVDEAVPDETTRAQVRFLLLLLHSFLV